MALGKDFIEVVETPTIPLKELWSTDDSEINELNPHWLPTKTGTTGKSKIGADVPFLKINRVIVTEIDYLEIDETGLIPRIKVIFKDPTGALSGPNYPKNDPIMSVYIKTQNDKFKPVRCDFLITRIKTNLDAILNETDLATGAEFMMHGELYLPKLYNNASKSYPASNSKDTLKEVATDSGLGYATNEFTTSDDMTWINSNYSGIDFIKHVTKHAYLDEDSFFTSFVDKYYHLNFINIAEQLNPTHEVAQTYDNSVDANAHGQTKELEESADTDLYDVQTFIGLTNKAIYKSKPEYIINYSLMGDTGMLLKSKGFKKRIYYYDHQLDKDDRFTSFYVKPVTIKGYPATSGTVPLEPVDESLKESIIKKWMNIDYGNTHREWNASVLINSHNNSELNKIKLKVETAGINFGIIRGSGIPVMIFTESIQDFRRNIKRNDVNETGTNDHELTGGNQIEDDIITGKYYVSGVKYIYDKLNTKHPFKTEFRLCKFNWMVENNIIPDA